MAKILIVDDEIDILEVAERFFKKRGLEVSTASEGTEALRLIQEKNPDLILLDFNMPGLSGLEILKKLREELKLSTKVIMVTGFDTEMVMKETKGLPIECCVHKPLDLERLETIVMTALKSFS